jgi:hypothetical protein
VRKFCFIIARAWCDVKKRRFLRHKKGGSQAVPGFRRNLPAGLFLKTKIIPAVQGLLRGGHLNAGAAALLTVYMITDVKQEFLGPD